MSEVREGYKMTELGEIPNDWQVKPLQQVTENVTIGLVTTMTKHYVKNGVPLVRNSDIKEAKIRTEKMINLSSEFAEKNSSKKMKLNDIVTVHTGDIGTSSLISENLEGCLGFATLQTTVEDSLINPEWLMRYFNSDIAKKQFYNFSTGDGRNNLNLKEFIKTTIIYPSNISEQKKIASIISTVDKQIDETAQLIVKTNELKKGLMQQLLTKGIGHTEFKQTELGEIPIDWDIKTLGELYPHMKTGATPYRGKPEYYIGDIPWLSSGELKKKYISNTNEKISEEGLRDTNLTIYPKGTFFIAITGLEAAGTRGSCGIVTMPSATNQSCLAFVPNESMHIEFLYYWYIYWGEWIAFNFAQGTKQQSLNLKLVQKLKIIYPSLQEQQKIAQILSIVDEQIEVYEQEKAKYVELKKGLMQQLLTGQIRVKI